MTYNCDESRLTFVIGHVTPSHIVHSWRVMSCIFFFYRRRTYSARRCATLSSTRKPTVMSLVIYIWNESCHIFLEWVMSYTFEMRHVIYVWNEACHTHMNLFKSYIYLKWVMSYTFEMSHVIYIWNEACHTCVTKHDLIIGKKADGNESCHTH